MIMTPEAWLALLVDHGGTNLTCRWLHLLTGLKVVDVIDVYDVDLVMSATGK